MDEDGKETLEMEEHVPVPKRVHITREDLEVFRFTNEMSAGLSLLKGTARQAYTENESGLRKRRGTTKAEAAQRRVKEYQDKAAERETKRTKTILEEGQEERTT